MLNKLDSNKYTVILDNKYFEDGQSDGVKKSHGSNGPHKLKSKKVKLQVHQDRVDIARQLDHDGDHVIDIKNIKTFLKDQDILKDIGEKEVNEKQIVRSFAETLEGKPLSVKEFYHSYNEVITELKDLEKKYPDLAKTVSLGKTAEGREIMAIKISKGAKGDTSKKVGFLITGCHHAREWSAMETAFNIPKELLENYDKDEAVKKRIDNTEIWVIPMVNPDGYEFSRNDYAFWRKNRDPIHKSEVPAKIAEHFTPDKDGVIAYGVDLNRNYYDGNPLHEKLYRPPGDTPESMEDDFGATSDNPDDETYRGPKGASEKEVQALINLWMKNKNIKAIVNHHNYGKQIIYPWGFTQKSSPNVKLYREITERMVKATGNDNYTSEQSVGMYPASGDPDDFASANGKLSFTIEVGDSFQPDKKSLEQDKKSVYKANMAFLDWVIEHNKEFTKGDRVAGFNLNQPLPENLFDT